MPEEVKGSTPSGSGELSVDEAAARLMDLGSGAGDDAAPTADEGDDAHDAAAEAAEPDTTDADAAELAPDDAAEADDAGDEKPEDDAETDDDAEIHVLRYKGKDIKVSTAELRSGYLKDLDYRRKTQELAQEKREAADLKAQAEQVRQLYIERLQTLPNDADPEAGTDWHKLSQDNPAEAQTRWFAFLARQQARQEQATRQQHEQQQVEQQRYATFIRENSPKMVEFFPEWRDEQRFTADMPKLQRFVADNRLCAPGQERWITPEQWRVVADAMAYRQQRAAAKAAPAKKVAAPAPAVQKPGVQPRKGEGEREKRAAMMQQFRKSGREDDAVALLSTVLG